MRTPNTPRRILLVDDRPHRLDHLRDLFEECGYEVMLAAGATGALQLLQGSDACVAIVDLGRGEALCSATLQAMARLKPRMPIVVRAAYRDDAERACRRHRNVAGAVVEPVTSGHLCSLIERIVSGDAAPGIPSGLQTQWARVKPSPKPDARSRSA